MFKPTNESDVKRLLVDLSKNLAIGPNNSDAVNRILSSLYIYANCAPKDVEETWIKAEIERVEHEKSLRDRDKMKAKSLAMHFLSPGSLHGSDQDLKVKILSLHLDDIWGHVLKTKVINNQNWEHVFEIGEEPTWVYLFGNTWKNLVSYDHGQGAESLMYLDASGVVFERDS
jgi:hypothetical protein